jgi:hypothetical protein
MMLINVPELYEALIVSCTQTEELSSETACVRIDAVFAQAFTALREDRCVPLSRFVAFIDDGL